MYVLMKILRLVTLPYNLIHSTAKMSNSCLDVFIRILKEPLTKNLPATVKLTALEILHKFNRI